MTSKAEYERQVAEARGEKREAEDNEKSARDAIKVLERVASDEAEKARTAGRTATEAARKAQEA